MNSIYGFENNPRTAESRRRGGKRKVKADILAGKRVPIKQHPAHTFTDHGVEIGRISAATRHPDGTKRVS